MICPARRSSPSEDYDLRLMAAIALCGVDLRAPGVALSAVRAAALRHRLESRCRPGGGAAGATRCFPRLCHLWWAGRAGRVSLSDPLRQHHRHGRARAGIAGGGRGGRRRRQHLWAARAPFSASLLGVVLIEVLQQSLLRWSGLSEFVKDAILGLLILIAITVDAVLLGRLREAWVESRRRDKAQARLALATEGAPDGARLAASRYLRRWEVSAPRLPGRGDRLQQPAGLQFSDRAKPGQSLPAQHRKGDRGADHDLRHHQRRDRPLGRVDDGAVGGG